MGGAAKVSLVLIVTGVLVAALYFSEEVGSQPSSAPSAASPPIARDAQSTSRDADPQAWMEQLEWAVAGRTAIGAAVRDLAETDPRAAAELSIEDSELDSAQASSLQRLLADVWARRDPQDFLNWARTRVGSQRHVVFLSAAVRLQHRLDADAAKAWVLGMPRGADRDGLLSSLLHAAASTATTPPYVDPEVLRAFDSDPARQRSLLLAVMEVAKKDHGATRDLIDEIVLDPITREQAEQTLAAAMGHRVFGTTFSLGR